MLYISSCVRVFAVRARSSLTGQDSMLFLQEKKSKKSKKHKHRDRDRDSDRERSPVAARSLKASRRRDGSPEGKSDVVIVERGAEPDLQALRQEARQAMARTMSAEDRE